MARLVSSVLVLVLFLIGVGVSAGYDYLAPHRAYAETFLDAQAVHEIEPSKFGNLDSYWVVSADGRPYQAKYYDYYLAVWASGHHAPLHCVIHRPTPKVILFGGHGWEVSSCHAGRR